MSRSEVNLYAFNRGLISPLALARVDIDRLALSAETYDNWMPRKLGSMMLRPGGAYIGATASNNTAELIPFVFSTSDTALIELSNLVMRVWVNDSLVTRASVSSAVTNGGFDSDVTSWTDNDEVGGASAWVTGGYLGLTGDGSAAARRTQQVTVAAGDQGTEHALTVVVQRGPVTFKVGSTSGGDDYVTETELDTGYHSLAFTPTGDFYIDFSSRYKRQILVDSVAVEASGTMTITTPFTEANLDSIRYEQSGDIIYIASTDLQQYKIERRSTTSWSCCKYYSDDGPFRDINTGPITIATDVLSGNATLTASAALFKSTNVGGLYRITSDGQTVTASVVAEDNYTSAIKVTGTGTSRIFTITRSGTWTATVTLQRSFDSDSGPWEDVVTYTTNATVSYDDALDNQTVWYRIGVITGDMGAATITNATQANPCQITAAAHGFATGTQVTISGVVGMTELNGNTYTITVVDANNFTLDGIDSTAYTAYTSGGTATNAGPISLTLDYPIGSITGVCRITAYTSETSVDAEIITDFGGTAASADWEEGYWSDRRGWPTSVSLHEGRMTWAGKNHVWMSVSDDYTSYDDATVGDSGPISRSIGSGPVDTVNFLLSSRRLLLGAEGAEFSCLSSGQDEPLTPSNFGIKSFSNQGSAGIAAIKVDKAGVFVQKGGTRLMEMAFASDYDYETTDLSVFVPEVGESPFTHIAVQRQPDTRIHCIRTDGAVSILILDKVEKVLCWVTYSTDGAVEDCAVLPGGSGTNEDSVYYVVNRTINGSTVRYIEKWSLESECQGGTLNKNIDSHVVFSSGPSHTISGLDHLEGESVVIWGDGKDQGTATVSGGSITLSTAVTNAVIGLPFTAQFKSSKLGNNIAIKREITRLGVVLYNTHYQGLQYGPDFTNLDNLPLMSKGAPIAADTVHTSFDEETFSFDGSWDNDSRLCLQAASPLPCTILAAVLGTDENRKR